MSHRNRGCGTLILERSFPGIGRISRASGTRDDAVLQRMTAMLGELWEAGCLDVLRALRYDRRTTPAEVYQTFRREGTRGLQVLERAQALAPALTTWLAGLSVAPQTQRDYTGYLDRLTRTLPHSTVDDLPKILQRARGTLPAPSFNRTRAACLAFLRDTVGRRHRLYLAVADVPSKTEHRAEGKPQPLARAREIAHQLGRIGSQWWTLCCTGMRWSEYTRGRWSVDGDRLVIRGEKTRGSQRVIPRLCVPVRPVIGYQAYRKALRAFGLTPRASRQTFAHWCELAGIPRSRRRRYEGHGVPDVHGLYEDHSPDYYLEDDRVKLLGMIGDGPAVLRVVP